MKYEHKCSNCGREDHYYAKGLCRSCYDRLRKNGTFEKQYSRGVGSRPYRWSEKTKRILDLHKSGMRQVEIVKEVGLTKQAVSLVIKNYAKPTNADRFRSMSDEELAEYFPTHASLCPDLEENKTMCKGANFMADDKMCRQCWLDWLKQEVSG